MVVKKPLTVGEKIKLLREAKGFNQAKLVQDLCSSTMSISRIERDIATCNDEMLSTIKKTLGVEDAPLFEHELTAYENRLVTLFNLIEDFNYTDARIVLDAMFPIMELPWEHDLSLMYSSLEALLKVMELAAKEGKQQGINYSEININGEESYPKHAMRKEVLFLYNYVKGTIYYYRNDNENAIKYLMKLFDYASDDFKPDTKILTYIGTSYLYLNKPFKATLWLERAKAIYSGSRARYVGSVLNQMLGTCYTITGEYKLAKELHEESLAQATSLNNKINVAIALLNLAVVSEGMGDIKESLRLCDQALQYFDKDESPLYYLTAIANKVGFLYKLKKYDEFRKLLNYGKSMAHIDESIAIQFEAMSHYMTLKNNESTDYLENVAIPRYRASFDSVIVALEICKLLENHYKRIGSSKKALTIAATIRDIYEDMLIDGSA